MKKLVIIILFLIIISTPAIAFSVKDFLADFRDLLFNKKINGLAVQCINDQIRCSTGSECGGGPCVMQCQNNNWAEYQYCAESCLNGQCVNNNDAGAQQFNNQYVCTQNEVRCSTGSECGGGPCVMQCQNNNWAEYQYCAESCLNGQCVNNNQNNPICTQGQLRCSTGSECGGGPCVMQGQNNNWAEYQYCAESCLNGQCVNNNQNNPICTQGQLRCSTGSECGGGPCVM